MYQNTMAYWLLVYQMQGHLLASVTRKVTFSVVAKAESFTSEG